MCWLLGLLILHHSLCPPLPFSDIITDSVRRLLTRGLHREPQYTCFILISPHPPLSLSTYCFCSSSSHSLLCLNLSHSERRGNGQRLFQIGTLTTSFSSQLLIFESDLICYHEKVRHKRSKVLAVSSSLLSSGTSL